MPSKQINNLLFIFNLIFLGGLVTLLALIFFIISKASKKGSEDASSFECGFSATFENRFSFSIHYYIIALIFLLLDIELCLLLPFFLSPPYEILSRSMMLTFVTILLGALVLE